MFPKNYNCCLLRARYFCISCFEVLFVTWFGYLFLALFANSVLAELACGRVRFFNRVHLIEEVFLPGHVCYPHFMLALRMLSSLNLAQV